MSNKTFNIGVIVSTHIDIPILVPENLDIKRLNRWELKENLMNGKFKCSIDELQETIQSLFSNVGVNQNLLNNYKNELSVQPLKMKKIDFVFEENHNIKKY